ncbi:hypothetical protein SERLA73DRAFT_101003 [Serpula lacrymans var. lacrymans S7.3]|uniref:SMP-LTD domain-containing protein n=1 Tax=Serpula lacrymans var. lacrymans (strain S7.3) TaxID=936435 RepID=F8PF66_SERL3|nr:hypothetical protein SERLA73DRAFT_101003 [Serpula lacrymans var. lacrymans S7.3]
MSLRALLYVYVLGGVTFIPLVIFGVFCYTIYTSVPVGAELEGDTKAATREHGEGASPDKAAASSSSSEDDPADHPAPSPSDLNDLPKTRRGWLTMRRTFEESAFDGSYVTLVRSFLDARSKDPKRSRPKDMWYVVLKTKVLYLYEDESMMECEAALELGGHEVLVYPEGLLDGELFAKRNAICLRPKAVGGETKGMPSVTKEMKFEEGKEGVEQKVEEAGGSAGKRSRVRLGDEEKKREGARDEAFNLSTPWFIFVRSCVEMEDWYFALLHASENPANTPTLNPLQAVFLPSEMSHLVTTLDEQPDVIPMRWLNALLGRIFFSFYRTKLLESYIIGRLMKKLSKVKRPTFLTDIVVTEFSVGNKAPTLSKPMLKELTKEGDASLEVRLLYKGEIRATVEATATINLGARFKSYTVKLVLAVVLRELEGNLLIKVKRPPSSRIWYAFTQKPRMVLDVEPIVSDRQITWSMILNTIESKLIEVIQESVVMPNMDDISFFDSKSCDHRGGIWSDSSRRERPSSSGDTPLPPDIKDDVPATPDTTANTTKTARRRSWFATVRGESPEVASEQLDVEEATEVDVNRGRTATVELESASAPKMQPETSTELPAAYYADEYDADEPREFLSPQYRRSSSQHSQARSRSSRTHSVSSSTGGDDSSSYYLSDSSSKGARARSPSATPTTPTSFLSTLKSKAGDKQALSNSAKEAMRKWGVNWGGLKKDSSPQGMSNHEDVPDVGPPDHRTRVDSNNSSQRTRPTYAEVRAAVAERKEREKPSYLEEDVPSSAAPIDIPSGGAMGKTRSTSISGGQSPSASDDGSASSSSPSKIQSGSSEGTSSKMSVPSLSRAPTVDGGDVLRESRGLPEAAEALRPSPSPIHTQPPQARTMTIPGIHASHRGEVMSMGYVAPSSSSPESKSSKAPAIQSVYRLWKSPILASQQQQGSEGQFASQLETTAERNKDVVPLSLSSEPAPLPRPIPPPLPPRTISSIATRHVPETPKAPDSGPSGQTSPASEALKSIVTKVETKRPVVEQSSPTRSNRIGSTNEDVSLGGGDRREDDMMTPIPATAGVKPPLPPRRIQAPA